MRILITPKGTQLVTEIEEMALTTKSMLSQANPRQRNYTSSHYNPHHTSRPKVTHPNRFKSTKSSSFNQTNSRNNSNHSKRESMQFIDTEKSSFTVGELKQAKHINLKMPKISFPKNFIEKYEKDFQPSKKIISTSGNFLPSLTSGNMTQEDEINQMNKLYSFKEIIPSETVTEIKLHMINDAKQKAKLSRVTENNFRTIYQSQTELEKFQDILDCPKVTPSKLSLIKYLNEKKKLNPIALKSLVESNPERISRVNKMCQILFHEEEQQRILNEIIKGKLKQKVNSDKLDFQNKIKQMKSEVEGIKDKLNKYSKRLDDRERYRDLHNDIVVHYWNKHDYDKYNKKSTMKNTKKNSEIISTSDNNNFLNNIE